MQVESFALLLWQLTAQAGQLSSYPSNSSSTTSTKSLHVVEFGSGSGNLVLPLAHLFPHFSFHAIDMKPSAVALLQERVDKAELDNVTVQLGHIENFTGMREILQSVCCAPLPAGPGFTDIVCCILLTSVRWQ
jgi:methylase of polypeptide subunit release factors